MSGINFFRIKKMEDLSREAMLSILRSYPVISIGLESGDYQTEFFVGIPSAKAEHDETYYDYASLCDVKLYDEVEEDEDGDIEFKETELDIFPNAKSYCEYAVESILDLNYDIESAKHYFDEDTLMAWAKGKKIKAQSKYNNVPIESSNMREYYQKYFSDNEYDTHQFNSAYSDSHHGEVFMNVLAMRMFGFTPPEPDQLRNIDVGHVPLEWSIHTDTIYKEIAEEGIEFYMGYCYVQNIRESEFSHDGEEFIKNIVYSHLHYENVKSYGDKEKSPCSPVPSPRF